MQILGSIFLLLFTMLSSGTIPDSGPKTKAIKIAIAAHDRAVLVKDGWIRDPYIVKAPDGFFYFTGTTQLSTRKELPEDKYTTGKGRKGTYNLYYAIADKITGSYGERKFAGRFLGHGTLFQDNGGRWWGVLKIILLRFQNKE